MSTEVTSDTSRNRLQQLVKRDIQDRPFSELSTVAFDHEGNALAGNALLGTLDAAGFKAGTFDAVGALTAGAVPFVTAMMHAATTEGQDLDSFVLDFVFPGIKGPSIKGKRVVLVDAWLSEKSYIQTSSLVTLKNDGELNLDFGILSQLGAEVVAITALVGGSTSPESEGALSTITVVNPVTEKSAELPFIPVFRESDVSKV